MDSRYGKVKWGPGQTRQRTSADNWKQPVRWNKLAGKNDTRTRVFAASLADWLDEDVPIEWLADFLKLIHDTPNLDWLLLTKRPEKWVVGSLAVLLEWSQREQTEETAHFKWLYEWAHDGKAPDNVWIGVSVENQKRADERIPELLKIPAKISFLSVEPLLGPVDLKLGEWNYKANLDGPQTNPHVGWVIAGGESGREARPCAVEWIDSIRRQCEAAQVPLFIKQLGSVAVTENANIFDWPDSVKLHTGKPNVPCFAFAYVGLKDKKGGAINEWPEQLRVQQFPKSL